MCSLTTIRTVYIILQVFSKTTKGNVFTSNRCVVAKTMVVNHVITKVNQFHNTRIVAKGGEEV
jgi:hypothetical protein